MEKKTRSSRRVPGPGNNAGGQRAETRGRRARTLADATDPRTPSYQRDDYEPEYSARDEDHAPSGFHRLTLPSTPSMRAFPQEEARGATRDAPRQRGRRNGFDRAARRDQQESSWDGYARHGEDWSDYPAGEDERIQTGRTRAQSAARPLMSLMRVEEPAPPVRPVQPVAEYQSAARALVAVESVPDLAAWRPPAPPVRKPVYTRAIETARRNPWSVSRMILTLLAVAVTLLISVSGVGEPSQPLMQFFDAQAASANSQSIADLVQPLTQGKRVDQYDSVAQYNTYWGAACSAAVLAEVLTAWGIKGATIGRMIDELGSYISPYGGLLSYDGFQKVASLHDMRSEFRQNLTYKQMLYITNTLRLPLIVNVRISYGFYHFFSGGHFMVMTAGDSQGLRLVDSSLYYVHYMPLSVFNSMFTGRTVLLLPKDYVLNLPRI